MKISPHVLRRDVRYNQRVHANSLASAAVGYEPFFGFHNRPFSLAPDTRFVYQSASHRAGLTQVTYALERREPIVVVTGEIGTGKTLLCRTVLERLNRKTFVSTITDPRLGRDDLFRQMLLDFGVVSRDRTTWAPASRHDLFHALEEFLASIAPLHAHAVVIIDEAQHVRPDVLEDVRLVSNVHDERGTLLQIVLIGQHDLEDVLARPELRQLKQRVSRYVRLEPLSVTEVAGYLDHRLAVARERPVQSAFPGARELQRALTEWETPTSGATFTAEAVRAVSQLSQGVPRIVNLLCDRALEAAYATQSRIVDESFIAAAARALGVSARSDELDLPVTTSPDIVGAAAAAPAAAASTTPAVVRARRHLAAVGVVGVAAAALWLGQRHLNPRDGNGPTGQSRRTVEPQAAVQPAPVTLAPPAPPSPDVSDAFEIVVSSFHTAARANDVAAEVAALGEPARVRAAPGWQQVVAGPYRSRSQGQDAQQRLARAGFTGTQLAPATQ
jgi:type II secretory pathway predicted ATPase ExeA